MSSHSNVSHERDVDKGRWIASKVAWICSAPDLYAAGREDVGRVLAAIATPDLEPRHVEDQWVSGEHSMEKAPTRSHDAPLRKSLCSRVDAALAMEDPLEAPWSSVEDIVEEDHSVPDLPADMPFSPRGASDCACKAPPVWPEPTTFRKFRMPEQRGAAMAVCQCVVCLCAEDPENHCGCLCLPGMGGGLARDEWGGSSGYKQLLDERTWGPSLESLLPPSNGHLTVSERVLRGGKEAQAARRNGGGQEGSGGSCCPPAETEGVDGEEVEGREAEGGEWTAEVEAQAAEHPSGCPSMEGGRQPPYLGNVKLEYREGREKQLDSLIGRMHGAVPAGQVSVYERSMGDSQGACQGSSAVVGPNEVDVSDCGRCCAEEGEEGVEADLGGWRMDVHATLGCGSASLDSSDVIGAIDFDRSGQLFATGGIARKVRVYSLPDVLARTEAAAKRAAERERRLGRRRGREWGGDEEDEEDGWRELDDDMDGDEDDWRARARERRGGSRKRKQKDDMEGSPPVIGREEAALAVVCTPAKLSSVKWVPSAPSTVGCGDYDGVVAEWDLEKGLAVCERDEHSGQRVWSIDYSKVSPRLCASASDDGTVRLWSAGMERSSGVLKTPSGRAVCSAEFSPVSDWLLALASADTGVYLYDLRHLQRPLQGFLGHTRTASYVRFLGPTLLASASIDSTIRIWDIAAPVMEAAADVSSIGGRQGGRPESARPNGGQASRPHQSGGGSSLREWTAEGRQPITGRQLREAEPMAVLQEHQNVRNFVGLSANGNSRSGLLATGSESNEVMAYRYSTKTSATGQEMSSHLVLNLPFSSSSGRAPSRANQRGPFVSAVCWRQEATDCTLVAANSEGIVRVLRGTPGGPEN